MDLKEALRARERIVNWVFEESDFPALDRDEAIALIDLLIEGELITGIPDSWDRE